MQIDLIFSMIVVAKYPLLLKQKHALYERFININILEAFFKKDISACGHYFLSRQPNKVLGAWSVNSLASVAARKEV